MYVFPQCTLACLSPGQEDTGINRDEPLIDEAVIEVFKKVRGGLIQAKWAPLSAVGEAEKGRMGVIERRDEA